MSLLTELQQLMSEYRFRPRKSLGQNFLIDEHLVSKMVDAAELKKSDVVLEIGCGTGFLTEKLLEKCRVAGFEKDDVLAGILAKRFAGNKGFGLMHADVLSAKLPKFGKVVSLPPYSISTELMLRLFEAAPKRIVMVFQREFSERLTAKPGFWEYNYLSALSGLLYDSEIIIRNIPPQAFFPKPESYSSMVVMEAKKSGIPGRNFRAFVSFLKDIFRYQNKNLRNALRNSMKNGKVRFRSHVSDELLSMPAMSEKVIALSGEDLAEIFSLLSR